MIEKLNQSSVNEDLVNDLNSKIQILTEQLSDKEKQLLRTRERCLKLTENAKTKELEAKKSLTESISEKDRKIKKLNEALTQEREESKKVIEELNESLSEANKTSAMKQKEFAAKIQKAKSIVENYKNITNKTLNRYIESKAIMLGISSSDIKNKLSENYNIDDIDKVCEDLQGYQLAISKLPMVLKSSNISEKKAIKVKVTESKEPIKPKTRLDDEVDDSLLRLAGLKDF